MIVVRYVLKSFGRHKARTIIMMLALLVVTAMLVTLNNGVESLQRQVVELVERESGEHDIAIKKSGYQTWQRKMKIMSGAINMSAELEKTQ